MRCPNIDREIESLRKEIKKIEVLNENPKSDFIKNMNLKVIARLEAKIKIQQDKLIELGCEL